MISPKKMINSTAPNMLRFNEATGDYSFDLSQFDDITLATLHHYVKTYFSEDIKEETPRSNRSVK
jgi:hypothetical protein